jgi:hypothetical protein
MKDKFDNILTGTLAGVIAAFVFLLAFYFIKFSNASFSLYLSLITSSKMLSPLISLSGIPNLLIFFLFLNRKKYKSAKGVILATFILVLAVIIIKIAFR